VPGIDDFNFGRAQNYLAQIRHVRRVAPSAHYSPPG
jgi:hypothetical protein